MDPSLNLVVFALDNQLFALELASVYRVVAALEVTPLPQAPAVIMGVINVHGQLFSVVNLRHRFRLPEKELSPSDHFILVERPATGAMGRVIPALRLALVVDSVIGIRTVEASSVIVGQDVLPQSEYVQGIAKAAGELILIQDLERSLSLHEAHTLQAALEDALPMTPDGRNR